MKAGVGCFARLPFFSSPTVYLGPSRPFSMGAGLGLRVRQELFSLGVGGQTGREALPAHAQGGVHVPVFLGLEASISFSRSSMTADGRRSWTRPADRPRRTFRHRKGLSL